MMHGQKNIKLTTMTMIQKTAIVGTTTILREVLMLKYKTFIVGQGELQCTFCKTFIMENLHRTP